MSNGPDTTLLTAARAPFIKNTAQWGILQVSEVCEHEFVVVTSARKYLIGLEASAPVPAGQPLGSAFLSPMSLDDEWDVLHALLYGLSCDSALARQVTGLVRDSKGTACSAAFEYKGKHFVFGVQ